MIQGVIDRLSHNSFLLKGWSVILVSALFALAASGTELLYIIVAYFPACAFWILDGYFLRQEKLFRKLYDYVRSLDEPDIDYSMDTSTYISQVGSWARVTLSNTLLIFHGAVVCSIFIVMIVAIIIN